MIVRVQGYPLKLLKISVKSLELSHFLRILSAGSNFDAGFLRQMAVGESLRTNSLLIQYIVLERINFRIRLLPNEDRCVNER